MDCPQYMIFSWAKNALQFLLTSARDQMWSGWISKPHYLLTRFRAYASKGTIINDLGGGGVEEIEKKIRRTSSRKKGFREEQINSFLILPPPVLDLKSRILEALTWVMHSIYPHVLFLLAGNYTVLRYFFF